MWETASTALRLQRSEASPAAAPYSEPFAPAADITTVAVVPSTKVRREISECSDTITPQCLTHAMHGAAAIADHGHIRIVNRESLRTASGNEILAGSGHQHTLLAQRNHIGA